MHCEICQKEISSYNILSRHITKEHSISKQEYYDRFLKKEGDGLCLTCRKATKFKNIADGYFQHCSTKCSCNDANVKNKQAETTLAKYGAKNIRNTEYYKEKSDATKLLKYGDINFNNSEKAKQTCLEKYGTEYAIQNKEIEQKRNRENMCLYGTENFDNNLIKKYGNAKYRNLEKAKETNIEKYGVENPFSSKDIQDKIKKTCIANYGVDNPMKLESTLEKSKNTNLIKYGHEWPQQSPIIRRKQQHKYTYENQAFDSSWELAYYIWLTDNNIEFKYQPDLQFEYEYDNKKHYYHPDFLVENKLQEIKGAQFFKDNKMVNPYDSSMNGLYEAKHQCMLNNNVEIIMDCSKYVQYVEEKYTKDFIPLFKNNLEFPYVNSDLHDTSDLGIIHHFHKSIYEATRKDRISPLEAWKDKNLIYKCALNRLKYIGRCRVSDVLQGFNVTKIAPKISVFKPKLAENLIKKYLNSYQEVFDPFSGFSGRMIGAENLGKKYIGQDIHIGHVKESNEIIEYKGFKNSIVIQQDILTDTNKSYECLFTCPPYGGKEHWNKDNDEIEKTCDEWINICLNKYDCKSYLFVVDITEKYKDYIVDTIENKSHFGKNNEYIILINKE